MYLLSFNSLVVQELPNNCSTFQFVTQAHLTRLYNELRSSTGGYRLLQEKRKKEKLERGVSSPVYM